MKTQNNSYDCNKKNSIKYLMLQATIQSTIQFMKNLFHHIKSYIIDTNIWIYLLWVSLHYISSHLYVYYCTPIGVIGFVYSLFVGPTPFCYALSWAIFNGNQSLFNIWSILGAICVKYLSLAKFQFSNVTSKVETNE